MVRIIRALVFGVALTSGAIPASSCSLPSEVSVCESGQDGGTPTGDFLGETPKGPVTAPYKVKGKITSHVAIEVLTVGGVQVQAGVNAPDFALWAVELTKDDLEANRVGTNAKLDIIATTVCGTTTTLASRSIPIGPSPVTPVTSMKLAIAPPPGECYLPADGSAAAKVHVTADTAFAFATVTPAASSGALSPSGNVILNQNAAYELFLTGNKAGTAVITVSSGGVTTDPKTILVAGAPQITPTGGSAVRGMPYSLYVTSAGDLAICRVEASNPGTVTLTVAEPAFLANTQITAVGTSVKAPMVDCTTPEVLRIEVLFDQNAPDGAAMTLRCRDTFGQEGFVAVPLKP